MPMQVKGQMIDDVASSTLCWPVSLRGHVTNGVTLPPACPVFTPPDGHPSKETWR